MNKRLEFHDILEGVLGSEYVYFQAPSTNKMTYPCIVYALSRLDVLHANNQLYKRSTAYTVTVIDPDPDTTITERVLNLPLCRFDRHFTADNLNHYVFTIYY